MSYTMEIVNSMLEGMIAEKLGKGYRKLSNGLLEDLCGQLFSIDLEQSSELIDGETVHHVEFKVKAANIVNL